MSETNDRDLKNSVFASGQEASKPTTVPVAGSTIINPTGAKVGSSLDIELPVAYIPLPSRGLIYDTPSLKGVEELAVRGMTASDEDILMNRALIKKGTVLTELTRACLLDKGVDINSMVSGDRIALLFGIRIAAYGAEYAVKHKCRDCETECEWSIDLASIPINEMNTDKLRQVAPFKNEFYFELPMTKRQVIFRYLTGTDEEQILREVEARKKNGISDNPLTSSLIRAVISVDSERDRSAVAKFCRSMPAKDAAALRKHMVECEPSLDLKKTFVCDNCQAEEVVTVELGPSFFWVNS